MSETVNHRRRLLTRAATTVSVLGASAGAYAFARSMSPSARALAAGGPVEVDVSKLALGQQLTLVWRQKPVWVLRRSERMIRELEAPNPALRDPDSALEAQQPPYAQNVYRSRRPEYFVVISLCTHLGCVPNFRPEVAPADLGSDWDGGYFCPCHGSKFDLAGRVYENVPAPTNLVVPPYEFVTDTQLRIGADLPA